MTKSYCESKLNLLIRDYNHYKKANDSAQAKVYDEDSEFGIGGGNISKLWIQGICNYDRERDEIATTAKGKAMVRALLAFFGGARGAI